MTSPLENLLSRLQKVKAHGHRYMACCPAHDDRDPSLSVREGDDGKVLVKCFAGCTLADIARAVGLEVKDLFADDGARKWTPTPTRRRITALPNTLPPPKARPAVLEHDPRWKENIVTLQPYTDSPAEIYLRGRSLTLFPRLCGVKYSPSWCGRPAVVFPVRNRGGETGSGTGTAY